MSRSKCIVCNDIRDIPSEAVPLVSFGGRQPGRGGSWEYEMLHRLCKADEIRHWKFTRGKTGQLFVMPEEARRALDDARDKQARLTSKPETAKPSDLVYESTCESLADIAQSLSDAIPILERLAQAAEAIATHPKQERYEILPTSNGNGFHP